MHYGEQGPDINHPAMDIELKLRGKLPGWLTEILSKASKWNSGKMTAVMLYEKGAEAPEAGIVVLGARDFKTLLEGFLESLSSQPSPKAVPSKSETKARPKSRWKSRPLKSRRFFK
jgi:hypothetical protein